MIGWRQTIRRDVPPGAILGGASAALCVGCVTPHDLWPLAPLASAPFTLACCSGTWIRAVTAGAAYGLGLAVACLSFLLPALHQAGNRPWPASVGLWLLVIAAYGYRAMAAAGLARLTLRHYPFPPVVVPAAWVLAEASVPVLFPWPTAIITQAYPRWLQLAEVGGPLLVSWWVVAVGAGLGTAVARCRNGRSACAIPLIFATAVLAAAHYCGESLEVTARSRLDNAPQALLGVVQGGTVADDQHDAMQIYRRESLNLIACNPDLDLIVWPETISPAPFVEKDLERHLRNYVRTDRREGDKTQVLAVPILLGLNVWSDGAAQTPSLSNSMVLLDSTGRVSGRYDKRQLVPLGESSIDITIPMLGSWELIAPVTQYEAGTAIDALRVAGHSLSSVICYEDLLYSYTRSLVNDTGSELLVSSSSDSWFDGARARQLHFMLASLRAVETRRYLLRATRDGISGLVAPSGRVVWSLPDRVLASGVVKAHWLSEKTTYVRIGDWPVLLLAALTILLGTGLAKLADVWLWINSQHRVAREVGTE